MEHARRDRAFTCAQVAALLETFDVGESRVDAAAALLPRLAPLPPRDGRGGLGLAAEAQAIALAPLTAFEQTAVFARFGLSAELRGRGLGQKLYEVAERFCVEDGACFCDAGYSGADCASAGCDDCAHGGSDERFWTAVSPSLGPLKSESVAAAGHGMWGAGSALLGLPAPRAMLPASPFGWWSHGAPTGMPLAPWGSGGV